MAITHARPGEPVDVRPLGAALGEQRSVALFKSDELEVIRLVLPAGKAMPPHRVAGEITLQCLEGRLAVSGPEPGPVQVLGAGQLLFLTGHALHGVTALEDASALLTIVLHRV